VSAYPTPPEQANLAAIRALAQRFDCTVGYSDHTLGIEAAVLSVALGARLIEKHFTLDPRHSDFRDHQLSADPAMLRQLVDRVRAAEQMLGSGVKIPQPCEAALETAVRRSIVAGTDLPAGHRLGLTDLTWVRPGGGLPPGQEALLVGRRLRRAVHRGDRLDLADVVEVAG
jgi:sialic acid synthase SpsE